MLGGGAHADALMGAIAVVVGEPLVEFGLDVREIGEDLAADLCAKTAAILTS